jgi:hypothetical protein
LTCATKIKCFVLGAYDYADPLRFASDELRLEKREWAELPAAPIRGGH